MLEAKHITVSRKSAKEPSFSIYTFNNDVLGRITCTHYLAKFLERSSRHSFQFFIVCSIFVLLKDFLQLQACPASYNLQAGQLYCKQVEIESCSQTHEHKVLCVSAFKGKGDTLETTLARMQRAVQKKTKFWESYVNKLVFMGVVQDIIVDQKATPMR